MKGGKGKCVPVGTCEQTVSLHWKQTVITVTLETPLLMSCYTYTGLLWGLGTGHSNLQQSAGHWLDGHQISFISHRRTSPFKVSHVIDYLIKRANWLISWLILSSEHLPQRAGGVGGVRWHPVPGRRRGVFRTLLHWERPGGITRAGCRTLQQRETMMLHC